MATTQDFKAKVQKERKLQVLNELATLMLQNNITLADIQSYVNGGKFLTPVQKLQKVRRDNRVLPQQRKEILEGARQAKVEKRERLLDSVKPKEVPPVKVGGTEVKKEPNKEVL